MDTASRETCARRGPPRVTVCIATHRRPEGLARLLAALDAQCHPEPAPAVRILVVDNDPEESARAVCRHAATWLGTPLRYATEKRRGIPQARNAALALALGDADLVAFTDDDCEPAPDWLSALLRMQAAHEADAVTGPCLPRFDRAPAPWIVEARAFDRPRHRSGSALRIAYTHNVLLRSAALGAMPALFDERFALSGGSDSEFFRRFAQAGHRIVWADDAVVVEHVPASRATLGWLLRRAFRVGTATARIDQLHAGGAGSAARGVAHGGWCLAKGAVLLAPSALRGRASAFHALRLAAFGLGRIAGLLGVQSREYARSHGR